EVCKDFEGKRDKLPYEIDGVVIKINDIELQEQTGSTAHHPRWAIAYKFKARQATSKFIKVEFQVGRTGSITPVAKIDPVHIGGVTVSSVSLFNADVIGEKDLRLGDTVIVKRAGEAVWRCVNINCEAQVVERIIHFVSKDAMDIKSLGEANIRKFFSLSILKNIPGIYKMDYDAIANMDGFGQKSIDNLRNAIESSKKQSLH